MTKRLQQLFTIPQGIGFSRRLLLLISGVVIGIVILFLYFLNHYAPKPQGTIHYATVKAANDQSTESEIAKLQRQPSHALIAVAPVATPKPQSTSMVTEPLPADQNDPSKQLSQNDFKEGSQSAISVYQHSDNALSTRPVNTAPSFSEANGVTVPTADRQNSAPDQNQQSEKIAFLNSAGKSDNDTIASRLKATLSPYDIKAGTIIPATLMTGINSDLPGTIIAKVRRDVFDTKTGNYLLIPQGTTLLGTYDSQVAYGQSRALIVWQRLIFPNSSSFDLQGMPGIDLRGYAGLHDGVDNHYTRIFGSALLFSVLGAAGQLSQPRGAADQLSPQQVMYAAAGQQLTETGAQVIAKNMSIQPTLTIRAGANFNVLLTKDMVLPAPYTFAGKRS